MSDDPLAVTAALCALDDHATPLHSLVLVAYLDSEGDECIRLAEAGDTTLTNQLGLLAWAQYRLAEDHCANDEGTA